LIGNIMGLVTGESILNMRREVLKKVSSGSGRNKLLLETADETRELLLSIGSYPEDPYIKHLVLGLMFIRYDSDSVSVSDEKQMDALGTIFEMEGNDVHKIVHWGQLAILYHTFSATASRFAGKAFSRLISSFTTKPE